VSDATPNDDGDTEYSPQNIEGFTTTVETTDKPVRIETEDGAIIRGHVRGDATITTVTDDGLDTPTGGFATTLEPAEVDDESVASVLIISSMVAGDSAPQFAIVYGDSRDDLRGTKVVTDIEVVDDE